MHDSSDVYHFNVVILWGCGHRCMASKYGTVVFVYTLCIHLISMLMSHIDVIAPIES